MKRLIIGILFVLGATFLASWKALAENGITVSPVFQEVLLGDEKQSDFFVEVTNNTETLSTFHVSVLDFGSLDESGGVAFLGGTSQLEKKYALASWMRPGSDTLTLPAGATEKVHVTIENRDDLSPGGHYAGLIFQHGETPVSLENGVPIDQIFSVLVFVKKKGGEIYNLEYVGKEWARSLFTLPEKIFLRFKNAGNVHVVPRGTVTLTDSLGRPVRQAILNEESGLILPETFRSFPTKFSSLKPFLFPGQYTLSLSYRYDGKDDFALSKEQFYYIPPATLLVILFLSLGTLWYGVRRWKSTREKGLSSGTTPK